MHITIEGYTLLPLTKAQHLLQLETKLCRLTPEVFSSGLKVDDDETSKSRVVTVSEPGIISNEVSAEIARWQDQRLYWQAALQSEPPPGMKRSHGSVYFVSLDGSDNLYITFDDWALAPNVSEKRIGNSVSIEKELDCADSQADDAIRQLCRTFFDGSLFDYGFCRTTEEFLEKNIDRSGGGQRAIGRDVSKYLPGFYWGNYFSDRLQARMPRVQVRLNGYESIRLSNGVLLLGTYRSWQWSDPANVAYASEAIKTIGVQFFFGTNANQREALFDDSIR